MNSPSTTALDALCHRFGVIDAYEDIWGNTQYASDETRIALLQAIGALHEEQDLHAALHAHEARAWEQVLPPVAVFCVDGAPYRMHLRFAERDYSTIYRWTFALENNDVRRGEFCPRDLELLQQHELDGKTYFEVAFDWRDTLPLGYHRYALEGPGVPHGAWLSFIVGPRSCYLPPALTDQRVWGPVLQLYSVRSERNWGMGDYSDLGKVVEQWGHRGAGVAGVNPLHALFPHNPLHASPYSPSSRLFLNVLYIDVEAVADVRESAEALAAMGTAQFHSALQVARAAKLVDYPAVAALKLPLLEIAFRHFREHHLAHESERAHAFRRFQADGGVRLWRHALFEALQEHFHAQDRSSWGWPVWPEAYRRPEAPEVQEFARSHS
ncbi:MAG TPA: 4-alpha-glucanotransferase, partial [Burkholderiales bacterium]|nr:4-alpha-glucanotransferase [Burkholderiales bacterium]